MRTKPITEKCTGKSMSDFNFKIRIHRDAPIMADGKANHPIYKIALYLCQKPIFLILSKNRKSS